MIAINLQEANTYWELSQLGITRSCADNSRAMLLAPGSLFESKKYVKKRLKYVRQFFAKNRSIGFDPTRLCGGQTYQGANDVGSDRNYLLLVWKNLYTDCWEMRVHKFDEKPNVCEYTSTARQPAPNINTVSVKNAVLCHDRLTDGGFPSSTITTCMGSPKKLHYTVKESLMQGLFL